MSLKFIDTRRFLIALVATVVFCASGMSQDRFLVELRDGNRLNVDIGMKRFDWREVAENGVVTETVLDVSKLRRMDLAVAPASVQAMRIQKLTKQLQSESYHERTEAEKALIAEGRPFMGILKASKDNSKNPEAAYRIERILKKLDRSKSGQRFAEFDIATLVDGSVVAGDAGSLKVSVNVNGTDYHFDRSQVLSIKKFENDESKVKQTWNDGFFHDPVMTFYTDDQRTIDFDVGPNKRGYGKDDEIDRAFEKWGCILAADAEDPSKVIITTFKINKGRSSNNSAAATSPKYKGTMIVRFCTPGNPNVPATVHRVGMYVGIVDNPREIVLDAFDANGHVIAYCEARESMGFVGVESPFPISSVRLHSNTALKDGDDVDDDFAIDDLCYNEPAEQLLGGVTGKYTLVLRDRSRLVFDDFEFKGSDFVINKTSFSNKPIIVPRKDVYAILTPHQAKQNNEDNFAFAMLPDQSIIRVRAAERLVASDFDKFKMDAEQLIAIWGSNTQLRYPFHSDFEKGKTVIVKPTHRVIPEKLEIDSNGMRWDADKATAIEQLVFIEGTPSASSIGTEVSFEYHELPSVWFKRPQLLPESVGLVRLTDGQRYVLGGSAGFSIKSINGDQIVLEREGQTHSIPFEKLTAIRFAE